MKNKEQTTTSGELIAEIMNGITGYNARRAAIEQEINAEKLHHESLLRELDNFSDLDNESGFLKLKSDIRTSEDRIDFLQRKKKAIRIEKADLEQDCVKFRQAQAICLKKHVEQINTLMNDLVEVVRAMENEINAIDDAAGIWTQAYNQNKPIVQGLLADSSGTLAMASRFVTNWLNRVVKN